MVYVYVMCLFLPRVVKVLNNPESPGIKSQKQPESKQLLGFPGKQLESDPESRVPVELHTQDTYFRGYF